MTRCRSPRTSTPPWSHWTRRPKATPTSTRGRPRSSSSTRTAWSASDRCTSGGAGKIPGPSASGRTAKESDEDDPRAVRRDDLGGGRAVPFLPAQIVGSVAGLVDRVGLIRRLSALEQLGVFDLRMRGVGELAELPRDEECHLLADALRVVTAPLALASHNGHPIPPLQHLLVVPCLKHLLQHPTDQPLYRFV